METSTTECKVAQQDVASKLLKLFEEYEGYFSVLSDKVSNIELRQSRSSGEPTIRSERCSSGPKPSRVAFPAGPSSKWPR